MSIPGPLHLIGRSTPAAAPSRCHIWARRDSGGWRRHRATPPTTEEVPAIHHRTITRSAPRRPRPVPVPAEDYTGEPGTFPYDAAALERVRMCLAEAGYDPSLAQPPTAEGYSFVVPFDAVPPEISWRARELAEAGEPKCRRCTVAQRRTICDGGIACLATRRHVLDCGAHDQIHPGHEPGPMHLPAVRTDDPGSRTCATGEEQ